MIIDTHGHVTGPTELHHYVRELSASLGPNRPRAPQISDERVEESLADHLAEVRAVGTDLQLISPRPWAVPTGDRRESMVLEMRGIPRRISPNRRLPQSSSRTISKDQRSPRTSRARAMEQNCP